MADVTHSPPVPPTRSMISPVVATPLAHRKRRHSEISKAPVLIDLTESGDERATIKKTAYVAQPRIPPVPDSSSNVNGSKGEGQESDHHHVHLENGTVVQHETIEADELDNDHDDQDDEDEDDESLLEDILDQAELEPYRSNAEGDALEPDRVVELQQQLREQGPEEFIQCTLLTPETAVNPALLGTAFGLRPSYENELGEEVFRRILVQAIARAYYKRRKLAKYNTIDDVVNLLQQSKNIMVITGAGISTSLGIPDFRSKHTGFYSQLVEMGINEPEEVFDIHTFDSNPEIFYSLARGILPEEGKHSPTHQFIRLLQDKGKLQTNYTQNIDNIEAGAGIDPARLIQCHGSFATATCRKCGHQVKGTDIFPDIRAQKVPQCKNCIALIAAQNSLPPPPTKKKQTSKKRKKSKYYEYHLDDFASSSSSDSDKDDNIPTPGTMKPDITFFGEQLPTTFFDRFTSTDSQTVDLVLVIGTSLKVAPVSEMPHHLPPRVPHVYISREAIEHVEFDVQLLGACDEVVVELARRCGWGLRHEMVAEEGLEVEVQGVEGRAGRWIVRAVRGKG